MKAVTFIVFILFTCQYSVAPPVSKDKAEQGEHSPESLELLMHYHRYLKQVVGALETDPEFKKKLEQADEADIRSGKIANELEFVSHHVRTQLDELKRQELSRLRDLTKQKQQLMDNEINDDPNHGHLDHNNPHTFEIEDLKKLIAKTTEDLAIADRSRREEFKQYEMQKEYEKQDKLNHTNGEEREKLEKEFKEKEEKHKNHKPLHEPGHKAQLEEVWEEQDHMQQEFNPKTFFMLHDLDSNGLWDQDEVKTLFIKELDKMYESGAPEDDMRERIEEMERMRETVFQEMDSNRDGFIDFHEFMLQTKKQDFQQDNGWKGLDEQKPFTDEELDAYIRQQQMMYPPPAGYHPPPGYQPHHPGYQQPHPGYQPPPGYHPPPSAYNPNPAYQPQFHGEQGNPQLNTNEIHSQQEPQSYQPSHQGYPNLPNQGHPNLPNQGHPNIPDQGHPNVPGQGHPNLPNQGHPNIPNQEQPIHPNQVNQEQHNVEMNQINQGQFNQVKAGQQNQPNPGQVNRGQPIQNPPNYQNQINNNQGQPRMS